MDDAQQPIAQHSRTPQVSDHFGLADLHEALMDAARTLPDTRVVAAAAHWPVGTGSALTPLPERLGGWELVAAVQDTHDVSFTIRVPYYDPPCNQEATRHIPFHLNCVIYYHPPDDTCLIVNRSSRGVLLTCPSYDTYTRLSHEESQHYVIKPGMWRLSVLVNNDTEEHHVVDFLMKERQFKFSVRNGLAGTSTVVKRRCPEETRPVAKRPKRQGEATCLTLEKGTPSESVVIAAATARNRALPATSVLSCSPLINLSGGEVAVVQHSADDAARYELSRENDLACTGAVTVFTSRHSAVPQSTVVTKIIKHGQNKIEDLPLIARIWMREKAFLQRLSHVNIVSLEAFDARVFAIVLELAPPSLNRSPDHFTQEDACDILRGMSSALAYLTSEKVAHNDIKPANIGYSPRRGPVLLDFGLASELDKGSSGGTHCYLPPEFIIDQGRGLPGDVWALGVTMLYVLKKTKLPEREAGYWVIQNLRPRSENLSKMLKWLQKVSCIRAQLRLADVVEGLVHEMLNPDRKLRVRAEQIKDVLESAAVASHRSRTAGRRD